MRVLWLFLDVRKKALVEKLTVTRSRAGSLLCRHLTDVEMKSHYAAVWTGPNALQSKHARRAVTFSAGTASPLPLTEEQTTQAQDDLKSSSSCTTPYLLNTDPLCLETGAQM
ncbi:hypothetical protein AOLI_G00182940 [Acnodon oligacanthus]